MTNLSDQYFENNQWIKHPDINGWYLNVFEQLSNKFLTVRIGKINNGESFKLMFNSDGNEYVRIFKTVEEFEKIFNSRFYRPESFSLDNWFN